MSRRSQQRPFRRPRAGRNRLVQYLAVAGGALVLGFLAIERFPEHLGQIPEFTALHVIEGPVSHIRDGDTIEVAGTPIRFGSLDCAERGTPAGQMATERLRELIAGQSLTCALNGRTSYDRSIGRCTLPDGRDLAAQMIREGVCGRYW